MVIIQQYKNLLKPTSHTEFSFSVPLNVLFGLLLYIPLLLCIPLFVLPLESLQAETIKIQNNSDKFHQLETLLEEEEKKLLLLLEGKSTTVSNTKKYNKKTVKASLNKSIIDEMLNEPIDNETLSDSEVIKLEEELRNQQDKLEELLINFDQLEIKADSIDDTIDTLEDENSIIQEAKIRTLTKTDMLHEKVALHAQATFKSTNPKKKFAETPKYQVPSRVRSLVTAKKVRPSEATYTPHNKHYARVSSKTAPLRSGPGKNFPSVFRLSQNATIEIEKQYNNWYRILHSSGAIGWIHTKDIVFGNSSLDLPGRVIKVKGLQS